MDNSLLTPEQIQAMSLEDAESRLGTAVYDASLLLERLENANKVFGNGHHMAQDISKFATDLLKKRWNDKSPKDL